MIIILVFFFWNFTFLKNIASEKYWNTIKLILAISSFHLLIIADDKIEKK